MDKEQLAQQYAEGKSSSSVFKEAHMNDFLAGYEAAQQEVLKSKIEVLEETLQELQQWIANKQSDCFDDYLDTKISQLKKELVVFGGL